jgi:penicillin-binding protein 1A
MPYLRDRFPELERQVRLLPERLRSLTGQWHKLRALARRLPDRARTLRREYPREAKLAARVALAAGAVSVVGLSWFAISLFSSLPDRDSLTRIGEMNEATAVYDASDTLAFTIFTERRIEVSLDAVSPHLVNAMLAIEDQRFYKHRGFDVIRIVSAALANLREQQIVQGGSTITQQLARASFLTPDKTIRRKLQELILAGRLESEFPKERILELYLNKVYFGDGLYGVEAASRGFFGKHASEVSLPEAAALAGLVKSPSTYAPTVSLERATARRNIVLRAMLDAGMIDEPTLNAARAEKMALRDTLRVGEPYGQYFKEQVRRELVDRFGWEMVYQDGLRVFSTIDMDMQRAAETAVSSGLATLDERLSRLAARRRARSAAAEPTDPLQAALIAMDPVTGHVRAMIGGRDFTASSFNRAVQARRQAGSAFKPFVYAAALERGFTPATVIHDLNVPIDTLQGAWTPEDGHSTADQMSLRAALRISSNRAAVRLLQEVGIPHAVGYAKAMGVGELPSVPSLALGSGEVTLQSMTAGYAAFASQGMVPAPLFVRRVEDREGRVLYASEDSSTRAISEQTAYLMTSMLADVIDAGTGATARSAGFTLPAAGKTGTTNDFKDAWFIGFTPSLIAGVWVGFDQPRTIMPNGFAGDIAVPIWASFMKAATRGDKPRGFRPPSGITTATVCRLSGHLASDGCSDVDVVNERGLIERRSMVYTEMFASGTEPAERCSLHPSRNFFNTVASLFRSEDAPAPPNIAEVAPPPAASTPPVVAAPPPEPQIVPAPERKKRGFWSRIFGIGRGDDDEDEDENNERDRGRSSSQR